ncbi:hypothetical protein HY632_01535 [Candidatus Uhrbacteria bacterium]|nr:hypothetical protein [Candidatus Uhrbacteria bacterium]
MAFDREKYDTKEGIAALSGTPAGLHELMATRIQFQLDRIQADDVHPDGFTRSDRESDLHVFIIHGRFVCNGDGHTTHLRHHLLTDAERAAAPIVMTPEAFKVFAMSASARHRLQAPEELFAGIEGLPPEIPIPPPPVRCPRCARADWTIQESHTIVGEVGFEDISGDAFIGKTLREVQQELARRTDGIWELQLEVHNDRWANLSVPAEMRFGTEDRGWRTDRDDETPITWEHIVHIGDTLKAHVDRYFHAACATVREREQQCAQYEAEDGEYLKILEQAGFEDARITHVSPPEHFVQGFLLPLFQQMDPEAPTKAVAEEFATTKPYRRIDTTQGTFGITELEYPMIDLHGTSITAADLNPEWFAGFVDDQKAAEIFREVAPFDPDPERNMLGLLFRLMRKQQQHRTIAGPTSA